ncbi:hypothetical protein O999_01140 [Pseudomonas putida LF54]|nr:hypothetical protein O999_01140 [Pseudomonas putida LF54]
MRLTNVFAQVARIFEPDMKSVQTSLIRLLSQRAQMVRDRRYHQTFITTPTGPKPE